MFHQIFLCFIIFFAVFSQNFGYKLRGQKHKGVRRIYGGHAYLQTGHQSVVNGKLDKKKMIEAAIKIDNSPEKDSLCGGTIIGDRFILTAAHCVAPEDLCYKDDENKYKEAIMHPSKISVYIEGICQIYGKKTCQNEDAGKLISAKTVHILEEYYTKNDCYNSIASGDLAIIELSEVIGDHGATIFGSTELPTSGDFMLSGFGLDPENAENTGHTLKSVTLTAQKCAEGRGKYDSICTVEIDKDACMGDSGGALVTKDNVIIGVVSGGADCEDMHTSVLNHQSGSIIDYANFYGKVLDDTPLKEYPGGVFTSPSLHYGFICDIVGSLQGCPKIFNKEPYLTIS